MSGLEKATGASVGVVPPATVKSEGSIRDSMIGLAGAPPFGGIMHSLIDQTNTLSEKADQAVTGLLSGQGVEIHDVMIAQQKASVAFELALQVRNKAVSAYQQMMGMQF